MKKPRKKPENPELCGDEVLQPSFDEAQHARDAVLAMLVIDLAGGLYQQRVRRRDYMARRVARYILAHLWRAAPPFRPALNQTAEQESPQRIERRSSADT